jgi:hypothetical protein
MKKTISLLSLLIFVCSYVFAYEDKPFMIRSFEGKKIDLLTVNTSGGYISVEGGNEANARVEVYIKGNSWNGGKLSNDEIKEKLKDYTLTITQEGNNMVCIAKNNTNKNGTLNISFKVFSPKNIDTDLKTSGGSINLSKLDGNIIFRTSGGSLNLASLKGKIDGKTSGGSINMENCKENIILTTSGGSVNAKNCSGNIDMKTSGGSFNLDHLNGKISAITSGGTINGDDIKGTLLAKTSGGSINLEHLSGNVDAITAGGSIDASFDHVDDYVKLHTSAGSIDINLPAGEGVELDLKGNRVEYDKMKDFSGRANKNSVSGKVNGGGPVVKAYTSSGNVSLSF